jgi:anti-sigma factor RsiW
VTHNCRDLIDLLTEYMEGGLPADRARAFEAELNDCVSCREMFETLDRTRAAVDRLRCDAIPPECHRQLRAFLDRELHRPADA